jgi:hypothetical protein
VVSEDRLEALSGFDQRTNEKVEVLILDSTAKDVSARIYQNLAPLEELRLLSVLKIPSPYQYLLSLPKTFQDFCDDRSVSLKVLRPLEYLTPWTNEIFRNFENSKPSASQIREILDLLCDLNFQGKSWSECSVSTGDPHKWILALRKLRFPLSWNSDDKASKAIQTLPWPRGVQAKWERQGDRAGVSIQVKVNNSREWKNLKESFVKLDLEDGVWKT